MRGRAVRLCDGTKNRGVRQAEWEKNSKVPLHIRKISQKYVKILNLLKKHVRMHNENPVTLQTA